MDSDNLVNIEDVICEKIDKKMILLMSDTDNFLSNVKEKYGDKYLRISEDCFIKSLLCQIFHNRYHHEDNDIYDREVFIKLFIKSLNLEYLLQDA
jgi:hypothetical protein